MEDLTSLLRILQVVLGIGMVIFVHESGHFLAARHCGVQVKVFSLGFGPKLFAWTRGATTYQIAAVPLGGYVKMKGEEGWYTGARPDDDDLQAKSVGQRFYIYSAGVLMNLLLGVVLFPLLFAYGVPFHRPLVGDINRGGPAWQAGLAPDDQVLSVDGREVYKWDDILTSVALGDPEGSRMQIVDAETGVEREVLVVPEYNELHGIYTLGVGLPVDPDFTLEVMPDSAAAAAGIVSGERLLRIEGARPDLSLLHQLQEELRGEEPARLWIGGEQGERLVEVTPELVETPFRKLGITPPYQHVVGVRSGPLVEESGLREDDRILAVGELPVLRSGDFERAVLGAPAGPLTLRVRRGERSLTLVVPEAEPEVRLEFLGAVAVTADTESTRIVVAEDSAAVEAGLADGDRILSVDGTEVDAWTAVVTLVGAAGREERPVELSIERPAAAADGLPRQLAIEAQPAPLMEPRYGLAPRAATYVFQTKDALTSMRAGLTCSWRFVEEAWITLKRMLQRQVSTENLGGIITIGAVSYGWASEGLAKLLFFLGMLSINLAFINVLPIPVLDGGHLFFLLVEKIKGSPVSEQVLGYSQMVGLVIILSLMVYVTFNDISRWFF